MHPDLRPKIHLRARQLRNLIGACLLGLFGWHAPLQGASFKGILIQTGGQAGEIEKNVAALLGEQISEPSGVPVRIESELTGGVPSPDELLILLGLPKHHAGIRAQFDARRIPPLTGLAPGPEGFLVQTVRRGSNFLVLAAGVDARGVLYAAGEILRHSAIGQSSVMFPVELAVRTAPAFEIRGTQFGQSSVAINRAKVRPWTEADRRRAILDFALAGMNTVEIGEGTRTDDPMIDLPVSSTRFALLKSRADC